jgi:hypothetical protein
VASSLVSGVALSDKLLASYQRAIECAAFRKFEIASCVGK